MATIAHYNHGQFSWIDLQTPSLADAKAFYGAVFGWTFRDNPVPGSADAVYVRALSGGRSVAGMAEMRPAQRDAGARSMWASYVNVDDLDTTTARVADLGGSVMMEPAVVGEIG